MSDSGGVPSLRHALRLVLFLLLLLTGGYFVQGGGANQNSRYDLTRAMATRSSLEIDAYHQNTFDKSVRNGHYYSDKAPGLSFVAAPVYAVLDALGVLAQEPDVAEPHPGSLHLVTWLTVGLCSALSAVLLMELLIALFGSCWVAVSAVLLWALGTSAFGYSSIFVAHQWVAALSVIAFFLIFAAKPGARRFELRLLGVGFLLGWAAISEYPALISSGLIFTYAVQRLGKRSVLPLMLGGLLPGLVLMAYNQHCFGGPLTLGYTQLENEQFRKTIQTGFFGLQWPRLSVLFKLLFGEFRGLLPLSPFLVLAVPGWALMFHRRRHRPELWLSVSICAFYVLLNCCYQLWHGGMGMGPRYLVPMLPFLTLPVAAVLSAIPEVRGAWSRGMLLGGVLFLAVWSIAICSAVVLVMPELPDTGLIPGPGGQYQLDGREPLSRLILPLLFDDLVSQKVTNSGHMSVAYLSPPSEALDAYNLGERWGLTGRASALPLLGLWAFGAITLAWLLSELGQRSRNKASQSEAAPSN